MYNPSTKTNVGTDQKPPLKAKGKRKKMTSKAMGKDEQGQGNGKANHIMLAAACGGSAWAMLREEDGEAEGVVQTPT